ncbi:conjugal transfer protein TraF [Shewanella profunda]|uniref:TlpA family protein disulfide reductase n=1 Tax=Shewanella profunda TaxID=254793 RepID=UPI00201079AF|nr:conjugal transfer protein TraF [Shewanella profunda]MCL1090052.1 conjugal transfer protein TraF [Shewanella profunda]
MLRQIILVLLCCAAPLQAAQLTRDYQFQELRGQKLTNLSHLEGQATAIMFFEPECPWCIKQAGVLKKLHQDCGQPIHPVALGVNGDNLALKRALFRLNFPFEAYRAPPELLKEMGGIPATPILLLLNAKGELVKGYRGYTSEDELKAQLCPTA